MTNKLCGCGGEPVVFLPEARKTEETWCVMCQGCTIRVFRRFRKEAEAAWNRALSASQRAIPREPTPDQIAFAVNIATVCTTYPGDVAYSDIRTLALTFLELVRPLPDEIKALRDAAPSSEPSQPVLGSEVTYRELQKFIISADAYSEDTPAKLLAEFHITRKAALPSQAPNHE